MFLSEDGEVLWAAGHSDPKRLRVLQKRFGPEEGRPSVHRQELHLRYGRQRGSQSAQYPQTRASDHFYLKEAQ